MAQELQTGLELPSDDAARGFAAHPLFSRPAIFAAYGVVGLIAIVLVVSAIGHSAVLIQPIDPSFHAVMIGVGVFVGVVLAAIVAVGRSLGIGIGNQSPFRQTMATISIPLMIVGLCGFAGSYSAERMVEWKAFHGMTPDTVDTEFTVVGKSHGRSGFGLKLQPARSDYTFSLACSGSIYSAAAMSDRLILPVEIGRGGVGRTHLPSTAAELRRD